MSLSAAGLCVRRQDSGTDLALAQWHAPPASPAAANNNKQRCEMSESFLSEFFLSASAARDAGSGAGGIPR